MTQDGVKALGEEWALKLDRTERAFPVAGPQRALWPEPRRGRAAAEDKLWNQKPVNSSLLCNWLGLTVCVHKAVCTSYISVALNKAGQGEKLTFLRANISKKLH